MYVDDLLLGAPADKEKRFWDDLASRVGFGDPPEPIARFLGAHHRVTRDKDLFSYTCLMKDFLLDAAEKFTEETGVKHLAAARISYSTEEFDSKANTVPGVYAKAASSHLMRLLYAARMCRPDLTVAIVRLAAKVTSWNTSHDRALKRLMQYCHHNADLMLTSSLSILTRMMPSSSCHRTPTVIVEFVKF